MRLISLILTAFALATTCFASDNYSLRMGYGVINSEKSALYSAGYEDMLSDLLIYKAELGAYTDSRSSRSGSPYGAFSVGPMIGDYGGLNLKSIVGPSIIGNIDEQLQNNLVVSGDVSLGYKQVAVGMKRLQSVDPLNKNSSRNYVFANLTFFLF